MKQFLSSVFAKDNKFTSLQDPQFTVSPVSAPSNDYEVTEISFEEYARYVTGQRKKIQAKHMQMAA